jgi:ADP-heptose:LPS heptosyltransferase
MGVVSFLMHAANGVDVPAVIVYGGRETPANSGYRENINLYVKMECSPCWLHDSHGDRCTHDLECMRRITVEHVLAGCRELLRRKNARPPLTHEGAPLSPLMGETVAHQ